MGVAAVTELLAGNSGNMIALRGRKLTTIGIEEATERQREVSLEFLEIFDYVS
jgi:hypothetical protein